MSCPYSKGAAGGPATPKGAGGEAVCPMGFGSPAGPKLSTLHCVLCRALLFEPVDTNCQHKFCRFCVERFSDCPLCGADITSLEPHGELQGAPRQRAQPPAPPLLDPRVPDPGRSRASRARPPAAQLPCCPAPACPPLQAWWTRS
jgi:hypothetical protein